MSQDTTRLAQAIGACRRAALAAGHAIRVQEVEVLLHIAAGTDHVADLIVATGGSRTHTHRALAFLSGRDSSYSPSAGGSAVRSSPFQLIEHRRHPHRRGFQWRLTQEGEALLAPCLHINNPTDWT